MTPWGPAVECNRRSKLARIAGAAAALVALGVTPLAAGGPSAGAATITSGPSGETTETSATFTFALERAADPTRTQCVLDGSTTFRCSSPQGYTGLALGRHVFTVLAFDPGGVQVGNDERIWTIVAPPGPGPGPDPEPPPPPFDAKLSTPAEVTPGSLVVLDASGSTGDITTYTFDLDGNGSFETKCGKTPTAGVVYSSSTQVKPAVVAVSSDGATKVAAGAVKVGGSTSTPAGQTPLSPGVIVGACLAEDAIGGWIELYKCPKTVEVGIGEAIFPPGAPSAACFKRSFAGGHEFFTAPKAQPVQLNGVQIHTGGSVAIDATAAQLTSGPGFFRIVGGGLSLQPFGGPASTWTLAKPSVVDDLAFGPALKFLGLPMATKLAPLSLTSDKGAELGLSLTLPKPLHEVSSSALVIRTSNTDGPILDKLHLDFGDILLGGTFVGDSFAVKDLEVDYAAEGSSHTWGGKLALAIPPPSEGIVATGGLTVKDGAITQASLALDKSTPGFGPIACCVYLTHLGGTLASDHVSAEVTLTAGPAVNSKAVAKLEGSVTVYWSPHISLTSKAKLSVVEVGIGSAEVYMGLNKFSLWGGIDKSFLKVFSVDASIGGGVWSGGWYIYGGGEICINKIDVCAGGKVAAATKGISGCAGIDTPLGELAGGGVYYWSGGGGFFYGCGWGKIKSKVGAPGLARAAGGSGSLAGSIAQQTLTIPPGLGSVLLRVGGAAGSPRVRLQGPDGRRLSMPGPTGAALRKEGWYAVEEEKERATYIAIARPAGGSWTITPLAGSPPIRSIGLAEPLPEKITTGTVRRAGSKLELRYRVAGAGNVRVTFVERAGNLSRAIGVRSAGSGRISFTADPDGPRARTILAVVDKDGVPLRTETIARFTAPQPQALPAPHVALKRRGSTVQATWSRVRGTLEYRVYVDLSDGRRYVSDTRLTSLSIPSVNARLSGIVGVQALGATTSAGRMGRARIAMAPTVSVKDAAAAGIRRAGAIRVACAAAADGNCVVEARIGSRIVARGQVAAAYGRVATVRMKLLPGASGSVRPGTVLKVIAAVPGDRTRTIQVRLR